MKGLSIEEKAKAYDEAIERARKLKEDPQGVFYEYSPKEGDTICDYIFPELNEESEDERIRKELIEYFRWNVKQILNDFSNKECISWLEKQGEQKPTLRERYKNIANSEWFKKTHEGMSVSDDEEVDNVNNIEPKFKVGDWIVNNISKDIFLIKSVNSGYCTLEDTKGNIYSPCLPFESDFHLWTIQDAKDGDVLCVKYGNDEMPFIFTGKQDDVAYCALNSFGEFVLSIAEWLLKTSVLPVTKEQHDTLFAKMKEAGYEWNAEKKELKKISQRMVSAEAKEALYDKPTWSVEDMSKVQRICKYLDEAKKYYADITEVRECINWLKSIKDRVQPKPMQKWKQENIEELTEFENAMMHIGGSFFGENAGLDPNDTDTIKEQAELLLELAPKQEWSEEDEAHINSIIDYLLDYKLLVYEEDMNVANGVQKELDWLKSLQRIGG